MGERQVPSSRISYREMVPGRVDDEASTLPRRADRLKYDKYNMYSRHYLAQAMLCNAEIKYV